MSDSFTGDSSPQAQQSFFINIDQQDVSSLTSKSPLTEQINYSSLRQNVLVLYPGYILINYVTLLYYRFFSIIGGIFKYHRKVASYVIVVEILISGILSIYYPDTHRKYLDEMVEEQKSPENKSKEGKTPKVNIIATPPTKQSTANQEKTQSANASQQQQQQQQQLLQQIEILGAVKVRDGLFLGDEFASQDLEFVIANKVTHIINCAGRQIFNQWTPVGVKYLTFYWLDDDRQEIYDFIEEANNEANGVLVHSVRGQSRACCVLSIYLMIKFKWTLLKSLEFVNSRRPNLEIRASFLQQLSAWERRTREQYPIRTDRWDEIYADHIKEAITLTSTNEELLLRNTFINAQMQPVNYLQQWKEDVLTSIQQSARSRAKLKWGDNYEEAQKHQLIRENSDDDLINKEENQIFKVDNHKKEFQGKTILKKKKEEGEDKKLEEKPINTGELTPTSKTQNQSIQEDKKDPKAKQQRKRPVTPLLMNSKKNENSDILSGTPRSLIAEDNNLLNNTQQLGSLKHSAPKRSSSIKKIVDKEQEEKEKRDKFKAKIAWNATSPKNKMIMGNFNFNKDTDQSAKRTKLDKSPLKMSNTNVLKKELLEKAKQALQENSKVTVGLDIKKIQETLNRMTTEGGKPITITSSSAQNVPQQVQKSSGNIINNNNINNFFIQNASVIEIPKALPDNVEIKKIQAPIGQHHHKRANSGSMQMAQQIKQNLANQGPIAASVGASIPNSHRKNQLSDHLIAQQLANPFILSTNATEQFKSMNQRPQTSSLTTKGNSNSRKDFKQVLRQLQKESLAAMQNSQQFWMSQAKKFQIKSSAQLVAPLSQSQDPINIGKKQIMSNSNSNGQGLTELNRPSSAQGQNQLKTQSIQDRGSLNRNRRLRKSNEYMPQSQSNQSSQQIMQQQINKLQRRAQTPMPSSPSNNIIHQGEIQNNTQKMNNTNGLIIQNMSLNNGQPNLNNSIKPAFKKRSKSPSVNTYQQKMQQKTVYMLLNNTFGPKSSNNLPQPQSQSLKRKSNSGPGGNQSPKKNAWLQ
ncbi:dual specificity catalytic domain containing protein [Stylonychia lemnae]|uniref:Dual specificity catalytic domain containing protein n=1 Tax=Stylonychia lemnae TaxID=5949 RepID=A0A078B5Z7_STYLE|nr:dual specificity catalytic domain containing protein [Stylonychia lemnae]|eukprot:CDW88742.1 dual specificity catalytic domain containing protein [Stylonychia lemnae]